MDRRGPRSALEAALHRSRLSAADRAAQISARERLPDLHRHRRRPGFRARIFRAGLWHSARAGGRHGGRAQLSNMARTAAGPHQGAEAPAQRRQRRQARGHPSRDRPQAAASPSATRPATGRCWNIRRRAAAPGSPCWCCTTTASANTPTGPRRACPIRRSGHSPRSSTTRRTKDGWIVVSMKNDWKRIFAFE